MIVGFYEIQGAKYFTAGNAIRKIMGKEED